VCEVSLAGAGSSNPPRVHPAALVGRAGPRACNYFVAGRVDTARSRIKGLLTSAEKGSAAWRERVLPVGSRCLNRNVESSRCGYGRWSAVGRRQTLVYPQPGCWLGPHEDRYFCRDSQ
jgi:hypothetical protein